MNLIVVSEGFFSTNACKATSNIISVRCPEREGRYRRLARSSAFRLTHNRLLTRSPSETIECSFSSVQLTFHRINNQKVLSMNRTLCYVWR